MFNNINIMRNVKKTQQTVIERLENINENCETFVYILTEFQIKHRIS